MTASDDFNRADGGIGANWTTQQGSELQISSNQVVSGTDSAHRSAFWTAGTWSDDQESSVTMVASGPGFGGGPIVRASATGGSTNHYFAVVNDTEGSSIWKRVAGTATLVQGGLASPLDGSVLKLRAVGTTLTLYDDGVSLGSGTDSDLTSGNPGIYARGSANAVFDNWVGDDVVGGDTNARLIGGDVVDAPLWRGRLVA